ncbi:hypothetical protein Bca4012_064592 [Brassica carinata]|uniref:F-box domain-containing protein n=1 Tax=Brassica carinata TaxID=52824 RepID=A0A8X8AXX1_BRACI|nr:hypothetical protein Bca52824_017084 [Brassica carinata]
MMVANLPNDLESEILARVPAKSLWELRATCKRWYALFRDPKFVEKNKKMSGEAARESMLLSNREVYSIAGDLHNSEPSPLEFTGKLSKDLDLDTISHCDGLILCQAKDNSSVVVWNPCTGETKTIEPRTCYRNSDRFALGYSSSSSRSYKILRCDHHLNEEKVWTVETEMYDLCSDSWRILDSCALDYEVYCSGVSLRGDTYFVAAGYEDSGFFLMKFDFTEERFVRLPLPFQRLGPEDTGVLSVVRDEKLSVSHQHIVWSNMMSIWVTNKVDEEGKEISWKKDFVFEVNFDKFELPCTVNVFSFVLDEEKKVAVCCEVCDDDEDGSRPKMRTTIFIVGEDMYKRVYNIGNGSYHSCPLVLSYVPSLVHIQ